MSPRIAVVPGSFDPITNGHMDIIRRASRLFDQVIVLVAPNADKHPAFTLEERREMIRLCTRELPGVQVDSYDGLLVDYLRQQGATAVVRGLRAVSDFEYEFQMALINKKLYDGAETVFLTTRAENLYLSSSMVRQVAALGGEIRDFVPPEVVQLVLDRLRGPKA